MGVGWRMRLGVALAVTVFGAWAGRAEALPDLQVRSLSAPATFAPIVSIDTRAVVKNRGRPCARASTTRFLASADQTRSPSDTVLAERRTGRICPGSTRALTPSLDLVAHPVGLDQFYLIVCADARRVVRESNERNNCRASAAIVKVTSVPEAPTAPYVEGRSRTHVSVSWFGGATPMDGFGIERQPGSTGDFVPARTVGPNAINALIGPVGQGDTYRVVAFNALGASPASDTVTTPPPPTPPISFALGTGAVTLSWTAVANATHYLVHRGTSPGGPYDVTALVFAPGTTHTSSFPLPPAPLAPNYYFVVQTADVDATSLYSSEVTVAPQ